MLECGELDFAVVEVTVVIAVGEPRCEFPHVALSDRLTAQGAEGLRPGRSAIHQDEFHIQPPKEKQSKRHLACTSSWVRRSFPAAKPVELSRSVVPSQTEGSPSTIEIAGLFGIPTSDIVMEVSAGQTSEQLRVGRFVSFFGLGRVQLSKGNVSCRQQSGTNLKPSWQTSMSPGRGAELRGGPRCGLLQCLSTAPQR